ncbi:50S ribosomal protein L4 [Pseudonocardia sp. MCCB 268]|nr:50S ribosomal protein L4 [Pseudonocardia cytotoxica]
MELPDHASTTANIALMHQVVTAQLERGAPGHARIPRPAARSAWRRQEAVPPEGTGRACQGSVRAPQFAGGGTRARPDAAHGAQRTPKKMSNVRPRCPLRLPAPAACINVAPRWSRGG